MPAPLRRARGALHTSLSIITPLILSHHHLFNPLRRVLVMRDGRKVEEAPVRPLRRARRAYTRELLAAAPRLDARPARPAAPGSPVCEVRDLT